MFKDSSKPVRLKQQQLPSWWRELPWSWRESLALAILAILLIDVLLAISLSVFVFPLPLEDIGVNFAFYLVSRTLGIGVLFWFLRSRGVGLAALGFRRFKMGKSFKRLMGAVLLLLIFSELALALAEHFLPQVDFTQEQEIVFLEAAQLPELVMAFIALVIIAPVFEEAVFRGLMLPAFVKRFGLAAGIAITSILFGLVHVNPAAIVITGVMGVLLAWLYYRSGSLWPAILFHSLKNLVAFIIIFFV